MINPVKIYREWRRRRGIKRLKRAIIEMTTAVCGAQINAIIAAPFPAGSDRNAEMVKKIFALTDVYMIQTKSVLEIMNIDFDSKPKPMTEGGIVKEPASRTGHEKKDTPRFEHTGKQDPVEFVAPLVGNAMDNIAGKISASITIKSKECEHEFEIAQVEMDNVENPTIVVCCLKCDRMYPVIARDGLRKEEKTVAPQAKEGHRDIPKITILIHCKMYMRNHKERVLETLERVGFSNGEILAGLRREMQSGNVRYMASYKEYALTDKGGKELNSLIRAHSDYAREHGWGTYNDKDADTMLDRWDAKRAALPEAI